jgi:hypothetical protein
MSPLFLAEAPETLCNGAIRRLSHVFRSSQASQERFPSSRSMN